MGRWIAGVLGALAVIALCGVAFLGYQLFTQHRRDAQAQANTDVVAKTTASQTAAGHDAVQDTQAQNDVERVTAENTRKGNDAILHAKGAATPLDEDVGAAGVRALCMRDLFKHDPACVRLHNLGS